MLEGSDRYHRLHRIASSAVAGLVLCAMGASAVAAQTSPAAVLELRGGVSTSPTYFGSEEQEFGPDAAVRFNYLRLPGGLAFGSPEDIATPRGFGVRGSLRYLPSRRPSGAAALAGTDFVERSLELGLGLGYEASDWRAFGTVRYGVIGHNAFVGEAGADALFHPSEALTINVGPRAQWGSERFMDTYFGVTADEAAANPQLDEFSASSGLYAVGVEVGARYQFSERWGVEGAATYDRLVDDAADSPITQAGSRDQFGLRVGITRTIRLGF